jgi:hypothetical protein
MKPNNMILNSNSSSMMVEEHHHGGGANNTNFETYYHNICASLQSKGEVHSVSKVFSFEKKLFCKPKKGLYFIEKCSFSMKNSGTNKSNVKIPF